MKMNLAQLKESYNKVYNGIKDLFDELTIRGTRLEDEKMLIANFLATKTMRSVQAVRALVEEGLVEDFIPISRGIYESSLLLQYVDQAAPDNEVKKIKAMAWRKAGIVERGMKAISPHLEITPEHEKETLEFMKKADQILDKRDYKFEWWRYAEVIGKLPHYEAMYPFMSAFAHPDAMISHLYIETEEDGSTYADPDKRDPEGAYQFGIQTAAYVVDVLEAFNNIAKIGVPQERFKRVRNILEE